MLMAELANKQLKRNRHLFYLKGNKQDLLLAHQLCSPDLSFKPITLRTGNSSSITNPVEIVRKCQAQLEKLYKTLPGITTDRADSRFSGVSWKDQWKKRKVAYTIK